RIVAVGCLPEFRGPFVYLVRGHQAFGKLGSSADEQDQKAGGIGIERSGMADFLQLKSAADGGNDIMGGRAARLVDEQRAVKSIKGSHQFDPFNAFRRAVT